MPRVHAVLPGDVDDPALVSGGNVYDRRVLAGLAELGWEVVEHLVDGSWPTPDAAARDRLAEVLDATDGPVLIDGLVACGVPEVVVPHGARTAVLVHLPLGEERPELDARERATLRATTVITTSPWAARRVTERHGVDATVAVPGTDPQRPAAGDFGALLCLGALTPTKGQDLLVEALARLADHPWTATLAGPTTRDPGFVATLRESIQRHGLEARIRIPGPLAGVELDRTWHRTGLLVVPSRTETYGMVATEALARGIPVVASAVGGLPETVEAAGAAAVLAEAENVPSLVAVLRGWFAESEHRDRRQLSARSSACTLPPWTHTSRRVSAVLMGLLPVRP